eukprot:CAMPEP_0116129028 /NCGR_PEP_ID=MMETSP0329-20121206/7710_1 /TAXON_ID=697910 /ORGANISM="Pseudo-nitzschia arenysensis, Strain B593" /LENGTH=436 /DNA_ID=CAMNT_0003623277 /DNA_START=870 /DNA_END=2180 /DNA_ORIENTATION=-
MHIQRMEMTEGENVLVGIVSDPIVDIARDSFYRDDRRRRRRQSRDFSDEDYDDDNDNDDHYHRDRNRRETNEKTKKEETEWPPSFQKDGSAFTFDSRSAMFYEPLSDFFYDPKSKLYYGNKKSAYFRYDDKKEPPVFVEVQKVTKEQLQQGEGIAIDVSVATVAPTTKPKIAIKFKTKTVKSSKSTIAAQKCDKKQPLQQQPSMVSKAKQEQIANIGKWNVKQAELNNNNKDETTAATKTNVVPQPPSPQPLQTKQRVRTTIKGEPICMVCKKKFPNLAKLRLHEEKSELHKTNLLQLQAKRNQVAAKRKAQAATPLYTDRAEKRRQLHGTDLGGSSQALLNGVVQQDDLPSVAEETPAVGTTDLLLNESNVGHRMLQRMGYTKPESNNDTTTSTSISSSTTTTTTTSTTNDHLRKEWDRIEAMAQKSIPRNRYSS